MPSAVGETDPDEPGALPESLSITRIDDLLAQMRFHEVPKRAVFSVPLQLADGFVIGVKGLVRSSWHECMVMYIDEQKDMGW